MAFPKSRILSTQQLIRQITESNRNGERFCFVLGSGASVESGIDSGNALEMQWMNCIMGKAEDRGTPPMDPSISMATAKALHQDKLIQHDPTDIVNAWEKAVKTQKSMPSEYYFDIYKLRFYPNRRNGYRYLERIMESCEPSIGYHTLALLLTENNLNNLVITTNFDSLVEDALFLFTSKKPLVVSHESLAGYIESDIQRPIIAKIHRGLMYAPFNSPETTSALKEEWRKALDYTLNTYTPIVIGYGGGDHSLMSFLEDEKTAMRHGLYWCYREADGMPEQSVQDLVQKKDGFLVSIDGFDALMMEIGKAKFEDAITPRGTDATLKNQYDRRIREYTEQWDKLNQNPNLQKIVHSLNEEEEQAEEDREKNNALTAWDYARRGGRALDKGDYREAVEAYTKAIDLQGTFASYFASRGFAYNELGEHQKAIEDCTKAIELDPKRAVAYNNRAFAYNGLGEYQKAIEDCTKAIEIDPKRVAAYNNRSFAYSELGELQKAIEDCTKAIEIDPKYATAYNNRAFAYNELGEYQKAIEDYTKAAEIDPKDATSYNNRAFAYNELGEYQKAIEDCTKAITLDSKSPNPYRHRGYAYCGLEQYQDAIADFTKAIELNPKYKEAYLDRAKAYRAIGDIDLAKKDEEQAAQL